MTPDVTSLVGRSVVDTNGIELGYVAAEDERFLTIAEGPTGQLRLSRRFVSSAAERVILRGASHELFGGLNVVDSIGEFIGIVRDTMEAEAVLDSLIIEDEAGEMLGVLLEDIRSIDEWVELDLTQDELYEQQA